MNVTDAVLAIAWQANKLRQQEEVIDSLSMTNRQLAAELERRDQAQTPKQPPLPDVPDVPASPGLSD